MKNVPERDKLVESQNSAFPEIYHLDFDNHEHNNKTDFAHNSKLPPKHNVDNHHPISSRKPRQLSGRHH